MVVMMIGLIQVIVFKWIVSFMTTDNMMLITKFGDVFSLNDCYLVKDESIPQESDDSLQDNKIHDYARNYGIPLNQVLSITPELQQQ